MGATLDDPKNPTRFRLGALAGLVTVEDARRKAMDNRRKRYHGEKLIHGKRQTIGITFQEAADTVIRLHEPTWKQGGKSAKLWRATLRNYVFPVIGQRPVAEITPSDVMAILDPIWTTKPETAKRVKTPHEPHVQMGQGAGPPGR